MRTNTNRIEPGTPVTVIRGKDKQAGRIIRAGAKEVIVKRDKALRLDTNGPSRKQRYGFAEDPYGEEITFRRKGRKLVSPKADGMIIGFRQEFVDYRN